MAQQLNTIQAKAPNPQPGQSRSVLRNQQQQKYLHNYLPSNAFQPVSKEMRINNQLIANKQESRTGSTIRNGQNVSNTIVVSNQSKINNYLQQQQDLGIGQSPLLKQNLQMIHKRSESVTNQRPPENIHQIPQKIPTINANISLYQKYNTNNLQQKESNKAPNQYDSDQSGQNQFGNTDNSAGGI